MSKTLPIHWLQYAGNVVFFFWRERRRIAFGFVLTLLTWAISVGPNFTRAICYAVNVNNDAYSNITSGFVARNYLMFSFGFGFAKWLANNVIVFCAKFPKFLVVHMKPTKRTTRARTLALRFGKIPLQRNNAIESAISALSNMAIFFSFFYIYV